VSSLPLAQVDHATQRVLAVTGAYAQARGYRPEEMVGLAMDDITEVADGAGLAAVARELERSGHLVVEATDRRKDGTRFPVLVDVVLVRDPDGRPRYGVLHARDLTELKRAEADRLRSGRLLRTVLDTLPDLVWLKDAEGVYLECNSRFEAFFGAPRQAIVGRTDRDFLDPATADFFRDKDLAAIRRGGPSVNEEEITFRSDGHREYLETIKTPVHGPGGEVRGVLGIGRNITRRRLVEERLRASEEKFTRAFHNSPMLASMSRLEDGLIIEVNDEYCERLGYRREEILGRTSVELGIFRAEERARLVAALEREPRVQGLELTVQARDGHSFPCLFFAQTIQVGGERLLLVTALDIQERKRAEDLQRKLDAEHQQMQKLDSLGSLASGVAHDMNNVLAAIQAVSEILRQSQGADPGAARHLDLIDTAAARGRDLVKGLTQFARKELKEPEPLDLNQLLAEEVRLLSRTTLQKVRLVLDLEEGLPPVLGERSTLAGALMNLCVNAVDAMPEGGTLTLRSRSRPGSMAEIQVEDDGAGMSEEIQARALEPFFTTKPVGKGTGLGLSMANATCKAHGGGLTLRSAPGRGTVVALLLPAAAGGAAPARPDPAPAPARPRRILLVDDDPLIQESVPELLATMGHQVAVAPGGREAMDRLAADPFDLVILDSNMPGWNGAETLRAIRRLQPRLPVILATGYLDPATEALVARDGRTWSLLKPFSRASLGQKLAEVEEQAEA
jgi:PAS domain S-box-containing protein